MTDVLTKEQRSYNMSRIKGRDTTPEITLRKLLFSKGVRGYRLSGFPGKPDITYPKYKIAIFVDGCFWHKCPKCFIAPKTHKGFWMNKIQGNVKRDAEVNLMLKQKGWKVLRFWEHETEKNLTGCYTKILKELTKKGYRHDNKNT